MEIIRSLINTIHVKSFMSAAARTEITRKIESKSILRKLSHVEELSAGIDFPFKRHAAL